MPITVSKMAMNEASITITGDALGDDSLTIVYYPNKLTPKALNQLDLVLDEEQGIAQKLSELLKSWDLLNDDGSAYPLDPQSIAALGVPVMVVISRAMVRDMRPN